jgi:uncharacterized protein
MGRVMVLMGLMAGWVSAGPMRVVVSVDDAGFGAAMVGALRAGGVEARVEALGDVDPGAVDVWLAERREFEAVPERTRDAMRVLAGRGGGLVAVHGAVAAGDAAFGRAMFGGAWGEGSRRFGSRMMLYFRPDGGVVGAGVSSFDVDDETVYDLEMEDGVMVLGSAFTPKVTNARNAERAAAEAKRTGSERASVYDIQPQWWTWEGERHRAVVCLQGSEGTLRHAGVRALLLRAVAWAGRMEDVDGLLPAGAAEVLRYPEGGPTRPGESVKAMELAEGFRAEVVAAEPLIAKPVAVQWDARGRLWVAETPEYPNGRRPYTGEAWKDTGSLVPGAYDRAARDSLSILEDGDGDGVFDRKRVWYSGIELACGFCFHRDGVIAVNYPDISWIRDKDGDGRAETVEPLFGNVPFPNHFVLNHLMVSPDGWVYASSGTRWEPTRPGEKTPMASLAPGMIRFRADGSAIEQVASVGGNSFGLEVTSDLESFLGMATSGNPLQHLVLPEWVVAKAAGMKVGTMSSVNPGRAVERKDLPERAPLMQIGGVGHYSAACASMVYEGGAWPDEWAGTIWCTEPILDVVHGEKLRAKGSSYAGEPMVRGGEWMRSRDYWFCPVDVATGPDGAMYVLDFYTPVVAHNDTRGPAHGKAGASIRPDREHYFGRIIRVQHERAKEWRVPDLSVMDGAGLVREFGHANRWVRFTAMQQLMERGDAGGFVRELEAVVRGGRVEARVLAVWALQRLGKLSEGMLAEVLRDSEAAVRKNGLLAAEAGRVRLSREQSERALRDGDVRVRLAGLRALAAAGLDDESGAVLTAVQGTFDDPWLRAAAAAAASTNPGLQLGAALAAGGEADEAMVGLVRSLAQGVAERGDAGAAVVVVRAAGGSPRLGAVALRAMVAAVPPRGPAVTAEVMEGLRGLLVSGDAVLAAAALPVAETWDADGVLGNERAMLRERLRKVAADGAERLETRVAAVETLVAMRRTEPRVIEELAALQGRVQPEVFREALTNALLASGDDAAAAGLMRVLPGLGATARDTVIAGLMKRAGWSGMLLEALESGQVSVGLLSPTQRSRLMGHPDAATAERAKRVLAKLGNGGSGAKDEVIARLLPEVVRPGDPVRGKAQFGVCAACHRLGGEGQVFGPALDGMGRHPVADLLVHVVDPNRSVDDEHRTVQITMKDGTQYSALVAGENESVLTIRQPGGVVVELRKEEIAGRRVVAESLMPEGLEALGAEVLRDIFAYLQSAAGSSGATEESGRYRVVDLSGFFTADNRMGLYSSQANRDNNLPFVRLGRVTANGVPFEIADPAVEKDGKTLIVLRADRVGTHAAEYPVKVEIPVGLAVSRLHFLGGVGGWGGQAGANVPAMKVTLHHAGGAEQTVMLRAGHEFADYVRRLDVPGSEFAEGIVKGRQVRTFGIRVERGEVLEKVVLESPMSRVAATTVAVTAELREGAVVVPGVERKTEVPVAPVVPAPVPAAPAAAGGGVDDPRSTVATGQRFGEERGRLRVLLAGAGGAHDFPRYFLKADGAMLRADGGCDVVATPNAEEAQARLGEADVLVFSANHPSFSRVPFMTALHGFADGGKGVVILHAGTWRNYAVHTGFNQRFVGGGAKGHGHGEFEVTVKDAGHPVMAGLPGMFLIKDESYHAVLDAGVPVRVLAENAPDSKTMKVYPSVWVVEDPKTRVVNISLGHAGPAHENPAFRRLLLNAVRWAGRVEGK